MGCLLISRTQDLEILEDGDQTEIGAKGVSLRYAELVMLPLAMS
jgi:hypothetical protein